MKVRSLPQISDRGIEARVPFTAHGEKSVWSTALGSGESRTRRQSHRTQVYRPGREATFPGNDPHVALRVGD